ncbi:MAG: ammonium transporter [Solirubrobacteraceae bacterium]|nr:ammonium transporter [Solirubrobacteraceae bacterium]
MAATAEPATLGDLDTVFVLLAAVLVLLFQPGFLLLEVGFSRGKNAGTIVAKILMNFAIALIAFWAVGFAIAFGTDSGGFLGSAGFFLDGTDATFPALAGSGANLDTKFLFQFTFAAVGVAILWGPTIERIKFGVYAIFSTIFAALIYPLVAHWIFGGGFLQVGDYLGLGLVGMQDFAGSCVVGVVPALAGLAAVMLLGPRHGKYAHDGSPRAIPGHNMPLFGLGVTLIMIGWIGFNGGSALTIGGGRASEIIVVSLLAGAAGTVAAILTAYWKTKTIDIGMAGNGMIAGLVAITGPSGYVDTWASIPIGVIAGVIVPLAVYAIDRRLDDPVGALSAHGLCGVWGTLATGFFATPTLAQAMKVGDPDGGLFYSGNLNQLAAQTVGLVIVIVLVFAMCWASFWAIRATYGLRVSEEHELAGLDISEHGMYGYPEQFIPEAEMFGVGASLAPDYAELK